MGSASLIILLIAGVVFSAGGIAVARIFVKGTQNRHKGQAYECGIPSAGTPWNQFNVGYYLYALNTAGPAFSPDKIFRTSLRYFFQIAGLH